MTAAVVREYAHSPGASLDYGLNWASWMAVGDSLATSVWESDSTDIVLVNDQIVGTITQIVATGGVAGKMYRLTNTITTSNSNALPLKQDHRQIVLICREH